MPTKRWLLFFVALASSLLALFRANTGSNSYESWKYLRSRAVSAKFSHRTQFSDPRDGRAAPIFQSELFPPSKASSWRYSKGQILQRKASLTLNAQSEVDMILEKARKYVFPSGDWESLAKVKIKGIETRGEKITKFDTILTTDGEFQSSRVYANTGEKVEGKTFWAGGVKPGELDSEATKTGVSVTTDYFHDGKGKMWKVDHTGLSRELEMDDREVHLFQTLIPTGFWMMPEVTKLFSCRSMGTYKDINDIEIHRIQLEPKVTCETNEVSGLTAARIHIDAKTGKPIKGVLKAFGVAETWEYKEYEDSSGFQIPSSLSLDNTMGRADIEILDISTSKTLKSEDKKETSFVPPPAPLRPKDTTFMGEGGPVEVIQTYGGHLLVPVRIGGQDAGMFLLDTGCGGMVLDVRQASLLGLTQFGEVYASVIGGTVKTSMSMAKDMTVGPMKVSNPLFACMDLSGLLENYEVSGILGYDFFRRTVVSGSVPDIFGEEATLALWDPELYYPITPPGESPMEFQPLQFLEDVPHIEATIWSADDTLRTRAGDELLMLDIGAGESACIFGGDTVRKRNLGTSIEAGASLAALSGGRVEADNFVLGGLSMCGETFERKPSRSISNDELNLSTRAAGAVCAKILTGCRFVVDYPRERFGIKVVPKSIGDRVKGFLDLLYGQP
ncbi:hypothetical protein AAMO2058_001116400 [Amorphochlora amoebiformis]